MNNIQLFRRPDVDTEVVEFDEWMTSKPQSKETIEETISELFRENILAIMKR